MPLLRNGRLNENNPWVQLDDEAELPPAGTPAIVSLSRFLTLAEAHQLPAHVSVILAPDEDPLLLAPWIGQLQLVCLSFPAYTDGRGYTQARLLRQRLDFSGEVRASGDVRTDQLLEMMRVGIDAFDFAETPDQTLINTLLSRYQAFYQPSYPLAIAG